MVIRILMLSIGLVCWTISGCSGNATAVASPAAGSLTEKIERGGGVGTHHLCGYYRVYYDLAKGEFTVVNSREVANHFNIVGILEQDPPPYHLNITGAYNIPYTDVWQVKVELENPTLLTGYDVRCIVMFDATQSFQMKQKFLPDVPLATSFKMTNPDAYTALYGLPTQGQPPPGGIQGYIRGKLLPPTGPNPNSTLNGYLRYASNDYDRTFAPGEKVEEEFELYLPDGLGTFGYAVDASWDPDPANAHCIEPWKVEVELAEGSPDHLFECGGAVNLAIKVYAARYCKDPLNVPFMQPKFECEPLFDGVRESLFISYEDDYALYYATVPNEKQAPYLSAGYRVVIKLEAWLNPWYPAWLDLSTYQMTKVFVLDEPAHVDDFAAQPLSTYRDIRLTWTANPAATAYFIEREDYSWDGGPGSWDWTPMNDKLIWDANGKAAVDRNAPFGGDNNGTWGTVQGTSHRSSRVKYRIKPVIPGCTSEWQETEGVPPLRTVNLAMWCVCNWDGTAPATLWARAGADFNDANSFWNNYGINFVLPYNIPDAYGNGFAQMYIYDGQYLDIPDMDVNPTLALQMFNNNYKGDCLNIYYVDEYAGSKTLSVCRTYESKAQHTNHRVFIISATWARNNPVGLNTAAIPHELGHALARLYDLYLLDPGKTFHPTLDCPYTFLFCDKDAAYPEVNYDWNPEPLGYLYANLMWWSYPDEPIGSYNMYQSQGYALESFLHDPLFQNNFEPWPE